MQKYCLTLDLVDDPELIAEYEQHHRHVWPEVKDSIIASGIVDMEIYRFDSRLFMVVTADDSFSFKRKAELDLENQKVLEWEELMWKYQQALPGAKEGEKWILMDKIFDLR